MKLFNQSLPDNIFIIVIIICLVFRIGNCNNDIIHDDDNSEYQEIHNKISQNLNKDNEKIKNPKMFNFASQAAGAVVLDKSPISAKGFYNLLNDDKDKYGISSCDEKKWVVIGLSEDILVTSVELANYEKYSSMLKDFQVLASNSYPTSEWYDLGTYTAQPHLGSQLFEITHNSDAHTRYLKFKFLTHYLDEALCTLSQIKVYGMTVIASFKQEVERSDHQMRDMLNNLNSELDLDYSQMLKEELLNIENNVEPPHQLTDTTNDTMNKATDNLEAYIYESNNTVESIEDNHNINTSDINKSNADDYMDMNFKDLHHSANEIPTDDNDVSKNDFDRSNTTIVVGDYHIDTAPGNPQMNAVETTTIDVTHLSIIEHDIIEQVENSSIQQTPSTTENLLFSDGFLSVTNTTTTASATDSVTVATLTTGVLVADDSSLTPDRDHNFTTVTVVSGFNEDEPSPVKQQLHLTEAENVIARDTSTTDNHPMTTTTEVTTTSTTDYYQPSVLVNIEDKLELTKDTAEYKSTREVLLHMNSVEEEVLLNKDKHDITSNVSPISNTSYSHSLNNSTETELALNDSVSPSVITPGSSSNIDHTINISDLTKLTLSHVIESEDNSPLTQLKKLLPFQLFSTLSSNPPTPLHVNPATQSVINTTTHSHTHSNSTTSMDSDNIIQSIHSETSTENVTESHPDLTSLQPSNLSHFTNATATQVHNNDSNTTKLDETSACVTTNDISINSSTANTSSFTVIEVNITTSNIAPPIMVTLNNNYITHLDDVVSHKVMDAAGIKNSTDIIIQKNILIGQKGLSLSSSSILVGETIVNHSTNTTTGSSNNTTTNTVHIVNNSSTIGNLSAIFAINCFENLSFIEFQKKMIGKLQQLSNSTTSSSSSSNNNTSHSNNGVIDSLSHSSSSDNNSSMMFHNNNLGLLSSSGVGVGNKDHNVFRSLMQKIKTLEMNHAIVEMYIIQMSECFKLSTREMQHKLSLYISHQNTENPRIILKNKSTVPQLSTIEALLGYLKHILLRPTDIIAIHITNTNHD